MVCLSNRFWAGLSLDLAIEQILMKSLKTNSHVLFQRLVIAGMSSEQLPEVFQYELSSYLLLY